MQARLNNPAARLPLKKKSPTTQEAPAQPAPPASPLHRDLLRHSKPCPGGPVPRIPPSTPTSPQSTPHAGLYPQPARRAAGATRAGPPPSPTLCSPLRFAPPETQEGEEKKEEKREEKEKSPRRRAAPATYSRKTRRASPASALRAQTKWRPRPSAHEIPSSSPPSRSPPLAVSRRRDVWRTEGRPRPLKPRPLRPRFPHRGERVPIHPAERTPASRGGAVTSKELRPRGSGTQKSCGAFKQRGRVQRPPRSRPPLVLSVASDRTAN